jgi:tungstate transport system substrate-binding protein
VKARLGQAFIDYVTSPEGQKVIESYKVDGQQLFYPDASDPNA